jgi:hypothetical protein
MTCVYRNLLSIDQVENRPTSARNDLAALLLPDPVGLGRSPLSGGTADIEPTSPNVRGCDPQRSWAGSKSRSAAVSCRTEVCYPFSSGNRMQRGNTAVRVRQRNNRVKSLRQNREGSEETEGERRRWQPKPPQLN